jgi:hypothetical protein
MKTYNIENKNILDGKVTEIQAAERNESNKVEPENKLECQATGAKVTYLFRIVNGENTLDVSAGVLKAYLIKNGNHDEKSAQKEIDRGYNVAYNDGKTSATQRVTTEEKAALVESFFA